MIRHLRLLVLVALAAAAACSGDDDRPLGGVSTESLAWTAEAIVAEFVPALDVDDALSSGPVTRHAVRQAAADERWRTVLAALEADGAEALDLVQPLGEPLPAFGGDLSPAAFTQALRVRLNERFLDWLGTPELRARLAADGVSDSGIELVIASIAEVYAEDWVDLFRLDLVDALPVSGTRIKIDGQLLADAATLFWADEAAPVFAAYTAEEGPFADRPIVLATVSARADDRFTRALGGALVSDDADQQEAALRAALPAEVEFAPEIPVLIEVRGRVDADEDGDVEINDSEAVLATQVATVAGELFEDTSRARYEAVVTGMSSAYATAYQLTLLEHAT